MGNTNPMFSNIQTGEANYDNVDCASIKGISVKTFFLIGLTTIVGIMVAYFLPKIITDGNVVGFYGALIFAAIIGFISCLIGRFSERMAKYCSVIYAVCEGLVIGTISAIFEMAYPGIAVTALFATIIIFVVMLSLYASGILRPGKALFGVLIGLLLGACALAIFTLIMSFFVDYQTYLSLTIGLEAILLVYGVICLSFHFLEASQIVDRGASKNAEWCVALGLEVTLIYIYVQLLRLLALLASKRN